MKSASKVSLSVTPNPALKLSVARELPLVSLAKKEPFAVLGAERQPSLVNCNITPSELSCFGPRGAALMSENGPFWVCDTGHHRLLGWKTKPESDGIPADWIIGQPNFNLEGRNSKKEPSASTLNVPTGICPCGSGMAVADAWNNRILIWKEVPQGSHVPADVVLGQNSFDAGQPNGQMGRGASRTSFHWPYGVACFDNHLFVADSENRRVLIWNSIPDKSQQPPDCVLGQINFTERSENAGASPTSMSMRWPHSITIWQGNLCVTDAGNNRIMVWNGIPNTNGQACDFVLGQANMTDVDHNQSLYWPRSNTLNMPYAISSYGKWLIAADTASSRLVAWSFEDLQTNASATALLGQPDFHEKGDNRWQSACADSICWPYGIQVMGDNLVVADSGNNRVSIWKLKL